MPGKGSVTGNSWQRLWRHAADAAVLTLFFQAAPPPVAVVECTLPGDTAGRVYRILDAGSGREPRWSLRLTAQSLGQRHVDLPLPDARVERRGSVLSLSSTSANGGLTVHIEAREGSASMVDVFVNFELEVNVWRDLSPEVEQMNTDGPQPGAACRGLSARDGLPYHPR